MLVGASDPVTTVPGTHYLQIQVMFPLGAWEPVELPVNRSLQNIALLAMEYILSVTSKHYPLMSF